MSYSLTQPLHNGWQEMKRQLFQPFDLGRWLTLGFSAWLAALVDSCGRSGGSGFNTGSGNSTSSDSSWPDREEIVDQTRSAMAQATAWLTENWWVAVAVAAVIVVVMVLWLALLWISSRGKLIFLDNVVHNRAEVVAPWKRFRELGNSLFTFRLLFGLASFGVGLLVLGGFGYFFYAGFSSGDWLSPWLVGLGSFLGLTMVALILVSAYLSFFLNAFVVPIMHRRSLRVMDAWSHFLALLRGNLWPFVASGIFTFVLFFVVGIAIAVGGFLTCCVGFLVLAIPYIGTVLLLPLYVTYRAFTVDFLAQFDPELSLPPREGPPEGDLLVETPA